MSTNTSPPAPARQDRPEAGLWLSSLESGAIEIIREGIAAAAQPVMLYSIGKDSSVLLHLARKAFWPAPPPMPLLHIDTTWKFRDMIAFRDRAAAEAGAELLVHTKQDGLRAGVTPFSHGSDHYTDVMKTVALRQALDAGPYDVNSRGRAPGRRRSHAPRSGSSHCATRRIGGIPGGPSGRSCGTSTTPASAPVNHSASRRSPAGRKPTSGATSPPSGSLLCHCTTPPSAPW